MWCLHRIATIVCRGGGSTLLSELRLNLEQTLRSLVKESSELSSAAVLRRTEKSAGNHRRGQEPSASQPGGESLLEAQEEDEAQNDVVQTLKPALRCFWALGPLLCSATVVPARHTAAADHATSQAAGATSAIAFERTAEHTENLTMLMEEASKINRIVNLHQSLTWDSGFPLAILDALARGALAHNNSPSFLDLQRVWLRAVRHTCKLLLLLPTKNLMRQETARLLDILTLAVLLFDDSALSQGTLVRDVLTANNFKSFQQMLGNSFGRAIATRAGPATHGALTVVQAGLRLAAAMQGRRFDAGLIDFVLPPKLSHFKIGEDMGSVAQMAMAIDRVDAAGTAEEADSEQHNLSREAYLTALPRLLAVMRSSAEAEMRAKIDEV